MAQAAGGGLDLGGMKGNLSVSFVSSMLYLIYPCGAALGQCKLSNVARAPQ